MGKRQCEKRCVNVSKCRSAGEKACRRCEGIGSRGQVLGWLERISLETSSSVRGEKMISCVGVFCEFLGEWS